MTGRIPTLLCLVPIQRSKLKVIYFYIVYCGCLIFIGFWREAEHIAIFSIDFQK